MALSRKYTSSSPGMLRLAVLQLRHNMIGILAQNKYIKHKVIWYQHMKVMFDLSVYKIIKSLVYAQPQIKCLDLWVQYICVDVFLFF